MVVLAGGLFLMSEVPLKDFGFRVSGSEFRVWGLGSAGVLRS